ncbi:hypothetical protein SASPL_119226 [Salvia splendens]|uniref:Uncharacterized protein n=1 Tax=Salvia splendens TaxID=180675 RepID=A0A8X8XT66_SALSN|nr:hypothetical protein SASPL_119226 [Salvia splendens]
MAASILRSEGWRGFYRGLGTSRSLKMGALEVTKSNVGNVASVRLGLSEASASGIANAAAGPWGGVSDCNKYSGGIEAFRKIVRAGCTEGLGYLY